MNRQLDREIFLCHKGLPMRINKMKTVIYLDPTSNDTSIYE